MALCAVIFLSLLCLCAPKTIAQKSLHKAHRQRRESEREEEEEENEEE